MKNASCLVGVDLGGTAIKFGICTNDGTIIKEFISDTHRDAPVDSILQKIGDSIKEAMLYAEKEEIDISAIGLGTPGLVDINSGYLMGNAPNFKYWRNVEVKTNLENGLDIPVFVDNDANAMAYGEFLYGAGKDHDDLICITLGTGIGGGIIIHGEMFRGSRYAGAELGHMSIHYDGKKCRCGGIGCWELYASATAMIDNYLSMNPSAKSISPREIFKQYERGNEIAVQVVRDEVRFIGAGLASLVNIFNPERIIIGGGLSEAGQWFIDEIVKATEGRAVEDSFKSVEIVAAKLGNKAGWLGAAALARQHCLST
jgi:glucokinase